MSGPTPSPSVLRHIDGLVLREATGQDADAIASLAVDAFGEQDGPAVRAHMRHLGGPGNWTVVCDGPRVVATCARIPQQFTLDGVAFPGSQLEYVITDAAHRKRGLIRAQFDVHHERSAAAGDLAQFIGGIPYLYRRLGYGYGLDHPTLFVFDHDRLPDPADVQVVEGTSSDLDAFEALDRTRPVEGLRTARDRARWELYTDLAATSPFEHLLLARRAGDTVGVARLQLHPADGYAALLPFIAQDSTVTAALIRAASARAGGLPLIAYDHPGHVVGEHLRSLGSPMFYDLGFYTRVPDPLALLRHVSPLLTDRLRASELADLTAVVEISLYEQGLALHIEAGEVVGIDTCPPVLDPTDNDGVGVAPDWLGALVFGRWGAIGLAERADDVLLGRHRSVMETLFPRRDADVVGEF